MTLLIVCSVIDNRLIRASPGTSRPLISLGRIGAHSQEEHIDKDRIKGSATQTGGKIKQAAGDISSDSKMQTEGKIDQAKGKAQNAIGGAKDALKK